MTSATECDGVATVLVPAPQAALTCGFDYEQLDGDTAAEIQEAAVRIRGFTRAAVIEVGCELLRVKERLNHGQFTAWVENECKLLMRTAQRAMRAAEMVGKYDKLSYLPPDGVLALAERSAPQAAVAAVIEEIEAGGRPSAADIRRRLRDAKRASNATTEARKSATLNPILRAWAKLQTADKETALIALWGTLSPKQQAAFRQIIEAASADSVPEDETALFPDTDSAIGMGVVVDEPLHTEDCTAADLAVIAEAQNATAVEAPYSAGTAVMEILSPADATSAETIDDPLEVAFAALSPEQRAVDRRWVMFRLAQRETPPADPSAFLQLYLSASDAEQKAFRARRVAEPIPEAA